MTPPFSRHVELCELVLELRHQRSSLNEAGIHSIGDLCDRLDIDPSLATVAGLTAEDVSQIDAALDVYLAQYEESRHRPPKLWMLWMPFSGGSGGRWVRDAESGAIDVFVVAFNRRNAGFLASHLRSDCKAHVVPVQVK